MHNISRLQLITQDDVAGYTQTKLAEEACKAGIDWVQLRVKGKSEQEWKAIALDVKKICDTYNARLIINDNAKLAKEVGAAGVHLGKKDMPIKEARKLLGHHYIIGGSANDIMDIVDLVEAGADYIGLGPFWFTTTKEKLSPVLGLKGYRKIVDACVKHHITTPIIAIGGIKLNDVKDIMSMGIYGVAIASSINAAFDKGGKAKEFINEVNKVVENYGTVNNSR